MSNAASAAQSLASRASSAAAGTDASSPASSPTQDSASPVAAGSASDYCGAFKEMQAVTKQASTAVAAAAFRQAAADMKQFAPAEITDSANAYADVLIKVAAAIDAHEAKATSTLMKDLNANPKMIAEVSTYVAKNCTS